MRELFESGWLIDGILAILALEVIFIAVFRLRRSGREAPWSDLAGQLLAGAFLLLAVRSAVMGAPWTHTATFLAASGPAHVFDLWRRWRSR